MASRQVSRLFAAQHAPPRWSTRARLVTGRLAVGRPELCLNPVTCRSGPAARCWKFGCR